MLSVWMEDEAVLDRGASFLKHVCDEEEVEVGGMTLNSPPKIFIKNHQLQNSPRAEYDILKEKPSANFNLENKWKLLDLSLHWLPCTVYGFAVHIECQAYRLVGRVL
ncbi:hypothetical protein STEG23_003443 [Scotinomys teguina]